jgi:uncharacterized protein YdhG (YjbR/CyaY superfamily)
MTKSDFKSVDEYIAAQPEAVQRALKRVRSTIRKAVPGAEEVISYRIPAYKLHGRPVLYSLDRGSTTRCTPATLMSWRCSRTTLRRTRSARVRPASR